MPMQTIKIRLDDEQLLCICASLVRGLCDDYKHSVEIAYLVIKTSKDKFRKEKESNG